MLFAASLLRLYRISIAKSLHIITNLWYNIAKISLNATDKKTAGFFREDFMDVFQIKTDDTLRETIQHGNSSYPFAYYLEDIWQFHCHCIDWHWHYDLEFMSVTEGTALCLVGADKIELPKGFGLFINSNVLHRYEAKSRTIIPNIVFAPALLAPIKSRIYDAYIHPVLKSCATYQIFDPQIDWQGGILDSLAQIYALQETGQNYELRTMQLLLQMWELLYSHMDLTSHSDEDQYVSHQQARLQTMMQYIHDHFTDGLTLGEIAASASISKSSALHIFQSFIHIPPVAYLIKYRLSQAAEQLSTTRKSVSAIAEDTGFANAGYFCRKFRQYYHMSPNEYRRKKASFYT